MKLAKCNNIADLRREAQRRLPTPVFHYLDGGADDELALANNSSAFDHYELLSTQLSDVSSIDTKSTLPGRVSV
ncbi:MAG: alpha-hydroxy-acid oxidizing protein [Proteobacteria bacterium]|nr:alpha-hydroxy-acid oxidizing protein [Pseudomonadota bacterium]